jgi:FkbM family methyltransferase
MSEPISHLAPSSTFLQRLRVFCALPLRSKYVRVGERLRRIWPDLPMLIRLPFGMWWIAKRSALDYDLLANSFENAELRFVERFLKPGMTVVDVGAHHGLYTLLASKLVGPTGKVIAFEPSPRERQRLTQHLRLNGLKDVQVETCALGSDEGSAELYLADGANDWCNSLRKPVESASSRVVVQVHRLDDMLSRSKLRKVDFLKLDVEGAELDTLKGASKLLSENLRPVVLVEVYDIRTMPWGYKAKEIVRHLSRFNYQLFILKENGSLIGISSDRDSYDANLVAIPAERLSDFYEIANGA